MRLKIMVLLDTLSGEEVQKLKKFLQSPYCIGQRSQALEVFEYSLRYIEKSPTDKGKREKRNFETNLGTLYPHLPNASIPKLIQRVKPRLTKLRNKIEKFWIQEAGVKFNQGSKQFFSKLFLAQAYSNHGFLDKAESILEEIHADLGKITEKDWNYFFRRKELLIEKYNLNALRPLGRSSIMRQILVEQMEMLEMEQILRQLWYACLVGNHNRALSDLIPPPDISDIIVKIENNPELRESNMLIDLLFHVYHFQNGEEGQADLHFSKFNEKLTQLDKAALPAYYLKLTSFALGYCKKRIFQGHRQYRATALVYLKKQVNGPSRQPARLFMNYIKTLAMISKSENDFSELDQEYLEKKSMVVFEDKEEEKQYFQLIEGIIALHKEDFYGLVQNLHDLSRKKGDNIFWNLEGRTVLILGIMNEEFSRSPVARQRANQDFGKRKKVKKQDGTIVLGNPGVEIKDEIELFQKVLDSRKKHIPSEVGTVYGELLKLIREYGEAIKEIPSCQSLKSLSDNIKTCQLEIPYRDWLELIVEKALKAFC